jgi:hypothetical protein
MVFRKSTTTLGGMSARKRKIATAAIIACMACFGLVYGFAYPSTALAWDNCPKGLVNDPYPGECRRYVDTNNDGICDLSQSEPVATTTTSLVTTTKQTTTTTAALAAATTTSGEPPTGGCPLGPCLLCQLCALFGVDPAVALVTPSADSSNTATGVATVALVAATGSVTTSTTTPPSSGGSDDSTLIASTSAVASAGAATAASTGPSFLTHYLVSPIALGFFLIYAVSFWLYKTKRIRIATHRKIWNVLLLATFLVTGLFGLILAIQLDYTLPFTIPIDLLFWHVEAGIAMTLISLFHMGWHFNYYKNLVRNSRSRVREARAAERLSVADDRRLVTEARAQRRADRDARRAEGADGQARARYRDPAPRSP